MDMDEDKLECGMLPIQLPLAYHDRIKDEEEEVTPVLKCKRNFFECSVLSLHFW